MDPEDRKYLLGSPNIPPSDLRLYRHIQDRLEAVRDRAEDRYLKMRAALYDVIQQYRKTLDAVAEDKREYDQILHEYSTTHDRPVRAHDLTYIIKWPLYFSYPHITLSENKEGWRVDIQPLEKNTLYYSDFVERIAKGETFWESNGLPNDPAGIYPRPQEPETERQQEEEEEEQLEQERQKEQAPANSAEESPSQPSPQPNANPTEVALSRAAPNTSSHNRLPGQPTSPVATCSPAPGPSDTHSGPTKRDKGKGKAVDTPEATTIKPTAPNVTSSSTELDTASTTDPLAGPTSILNTAGPSNASRNAINGNENSTDDIVSSSAINEGSNQATTSNNAVEKGAVNRPRRTTRISLITNPATKKDLADKVKVKGTGKGKGVARPSNAGKNNMNDRVTKPGSSEQPSTVARRETIKRARLYKEKYWAFKLDASMFTDTGRIKKQFWYGKANGEPVTAVDANSNNDKPHGNDDSADDGKGRRKSAAITSSPKDVKSEGQKTLDDGLALDANADNNDNFDSGAETDDSKDSNFTLTQKPKNRKATITAKTSSSSSSNKRKRADTDTGNEPEATYNEEDPNAYYVLRCPLGELCETETPLTDKPEEHIKGAFTRHPFKKRRALEHFRSCKLGRTYKSEYEIWKNCCWKVIPDMKSRPVDDKWANNHNRKLMNSLVRQADVTKEAKKKLKEEIEKEL
ncbi:hypothetical protein B0T20DRAFT_495938 [Sordaria brevicollis]|uniref:Uncharacterized protein n=1 Tax=Sordaria brevicollis TaxID=83679 RepID=A0AAE0PHB8_SORBR|nr:hypothetical protein B0T20DRAFT_495938 [Sordaria brevicollis]